MDTIGHWQGALPAWRGDRPRLVVLPFAAYDYDGYQAVYARRLAEWLASRLHATDVLDAAFPLLLGNQGNAAEYAMLTRTPEPQAVQELCRGAQADWAVFGRFNLLDRFEWEIVLLNVKSGEIAYAEERQGEAHLLLEAVTVVALRIIRAIIGERLPDDARSRLLDHGTRSLDAVRAFFLASDLMSHPARTPLDVTNGLAYAFAALESDQDFRSPADLIIAEALNRIERTSDVEGGLALLERLTATAPGYHKVAAAVGSVWQRGGNHAEAAQAYREALRLSPGHPYYLYRLAVSLDQLDDPGALEALQAAHAADPANEAVEDLLGARLANSGQIGAAMELWASQLARKPSHAPALTNLGAAYESVRDLDRARQHYEAALQVAPSYGPALDRYAEYLARNGEVTRAVGLLERLQKQRPDDPAVLERLARLLARVDQPEQELAVLRQLIQLQPGHSPALYRRAVRLRQMGRTEEAISAYRQLLERFPDHAGALVDLGVLLGSRREVTEAAGLLARARQLAPEDANAAYNYAVVQLERGAIDEAEAILTELQARTPADPMPGRVLSELRRRRSRGY